MQEEMLALSREYGEARLAAWAREMRDMASGWEDFLKDWQGTLEQMSGFAFGVFQAVAAQGEASSQQLSQNWHRALAEMTMEVEAFGETVLRTLDKVGGGWPGRARGGEDWLSFLGFDFGLGGLFHEGGIVEAHRGMVVNPETLLGEERLAVVQTGEGILPREAMVRLGEENFEALRNGRFEVSSGGLSPHYQITIQVQSLDPAAAASLDWDRLVQRHLLPALRRDLDRRW
jgi:hypothetical protein